MKRMTKRQTRIALAKVAGYHDDRRGWMRALIGSGVSFRDMEDAFFAGEVARENGTPCDCHACRRPR